MSPCCYICKTINSLPKHSWVSQETHHGRHGKLPKVHLLCQPIHLPASVAEDDCLPDGDHLVEIAQSIQLPLLLFDRDVELLNISRGQFDPLDDNPDGFSHELFGCLEHVRGHGGREKNNLSVLREELEDPIDPALETLGQHLISFLETEDLDVVSPEGPAVDHIEDATRSTNDNLRALLQLCRVLTDVGPTNRGVTFDVHVVAESNDDLLNLLSKLGGRCEDENLGAFDREVEFLNSGDGEGCGLANTRLSLSDNILTLDDGEDRTSLEDGRTLETREIKR